MSRDERAAGRPAPGPLPGLLVLTAAYLLSQFFRTALGVVAPEIAADLGLDPKQLGLLTAAWFVAFGLAQLPVGVSLDRFGPRLTVSAVFGGAALGCLVFASARGLPAALVGQALIGVGCAPVYMGMLVVLARWYEPRRFAFLSSLGLAAGGIGNILGTTPLALLIAGVGWRAAFVVLAGLVGVATLAVALVVRDAPPGWHHAAATERLGAVLRGVGRVLANRALWPILPLCFVGYAAMVALRGLWGGPYLRDVFGFGPVARGNLLLAMSVAMSAGPLLYGLLERRLDRRKALVVAGTSVQLLAAAVLALAPDRSAALAAALLALTGLTGSTYTLLIAQGRRFLADHEVGRGLTLLNGAVMLGTAVVQIGTGLVVDAAAASGAGPAATYRWLFATLALVLAAALAVYVRSRDRRLERP